MSDSLQNILSSNQHWQDSEMQEFRARFLAPIHSDIKSGMAELKSMENLCAGALTFLRGVRPFSQVTLHDIPPMPPVPDYLYR